MGFTAGMFQSILHEYGVLEIRLSGQEKTLTE